MSSNTTLLIKQAQILPDGNFLLGDTKIKNGKIAEIAPEINSEDNDEIVEATGLILLSGADRSSSSFS